jgi:hypothetical protein
MGTYNGQDPIYPAVSNTKCNKPKDYRRKWDTDGDHGSPDPDISGPFMLEEGFRNNTATDGGGRTDEEARDGSTKCHGTIRVTNSAANIAHKAEEKG